MLSELRMVPSRGLLLIVETAWDGEIVLKARLPVHPGHPRAAITVLEGLALWSGHKLPVAVGVNARSTDYVADLLPDGPTWASPLVDLHLVDHPPARTQWLMTNGRPPLGPQWLMTNGRPPLGPDRPQLGNLRSTEWLIASA
jgi:hypothetical protein